MGGGWLVGGCGGLWELYEVQSGRLGGWRSGPGRGRRVCHLPGAGYCVELPGSAVVCGGGGGGWRTCVKRGRGRERGSRHGNRRRFMQLGLL